MRLIDADALMEELGARYAHLVTEYGYRDHYTRGFEAALDKAEAAPTIDAVPVVRCGECKHCGIFLYSRVMYCVNPMGRNGCVPTKGDAFCSYGERRSDD